ncbi:MAG: DUF975 family protein [Oscillospiraceae bacterium]|jgi:uncharacterized membrane protein|nr:DUF975 family protein [Oscillospiraceae bacterium]
MTYDRAYLKEGAKASMRGYKPNPMGVSAVYLLILLIFSFLSQRLNNYTALYYELLQAFPYSGSTMSIPTSSPMNTVLLIVLQFAEMTLGVGFSIFCIRISRAEKGGFEDLFAAFPKFFRYAGLSIVMGVFIALWSLLLVVPGLIAAYRYRLSIYLAIDHPDWGIMDCIRESKRLMIGHKGKAFVLDLSFIGWMFLTGLTLGILGIWTTPYFRISQVRFYEYVLAANGKSYTIPEPHSSDDENGSDGN